MKPTHARGDDHWRRRMPERIARGPDSPLSKLDRDQITSLLADAKTGMQASALGEKYGVSRQTVWRRLRDARG